ncbi:MAG: GNAT family N-acetyltransferase [Pseudomonadota bacterium]
MTITIRDAVPDDVTAIALYNAAMALETEVKALDLEVLTAGVRSLLEDDNRGRYWVAESDGNPIGQVMITREWSDWRNAWFWWLQSVYIAPDFRRRGVFRALYEHVREQARSANACGLRLYVEHDNTAAADTYRALGMIDAGYAMLELTFDD